jgi:16S rRNA (cytosine1402-N4)-methyltransferase
MSRPSVHIPVLLKEVLECLNPRPAENFIDATFGNGGHSLAILQRNAPNGKLLAIERDPGLFKEMEKSGLSVFGRDFKRLILINDNFANLRNIVQKRRFQPVQGILFDLGMSSWHLEESGRGFSFQKNEKLDMRYGRQELTAVEIVNTWGPKQIEKILRDYGEERFARVISANIVSERKKKAIVTTYQLARLIRESVPGWYSRRRINPATKTFQALRIAVNQELENIESALPQAMEILAAGGRMAVISFHSLEDRIVKIFFKEQKQIGRAKLLSKKPLRPTAKELEINPRSRSAKLRALVKLN